MLFADPTIVAPDALMAEAQAEVVPEAGSAIPPLELVQR